MFIHKKIIYDMAEEKRSTQENEFEESQTNDTEKEEVNSEKHQGEAHKKTSLAEKRISNWKSWDRN